ncbi:3838_t:CDS:2, partial [Acaulospora morrowiae]
MRSEILFALSFFALFSLINSLPLQPSFEESSHEISSISGDTVSPRVEFFPMLDDSPTANEIAIGIIEIAIGIIEGVIGIIEGAIGIIEGAIGIIEGAIGIIEGAIGVRGINVV